MFNDRTALRQQSACRALRGEERRCFSHLELVKAYFVETYLSADSVFAYRSLSSFTAKNRHLLQLFALSAE